jgi:hypothetical protein
VALGNQMRSSASFVGSLVGHGRPVQLRKTYCEAVCDCCAGGGTFSPWCCISCASCDYFKVNFSDLAVGRVAVCQGLDSLDRVEGNFFPSFCAAIFSANTAGGILRAE